MRVITSEKRPIKMWIKDIEDGALEQAKNLANLPFIHKHVAIMPDSHLGYGMPIGGVIATTGVIIPNAVGVDIGCGMCAVRTSLKSIDIELLKEIMGEIREAVPVGFKHQKEMQDDILMPQIENFELYKVVAKEYNSARKQLGTLGGGNHFIEIQKDNEDFIWLMIHSGSRNLGYKVADYYNKIAIELNERYHSSIPKAQELAFLSLNTEEAQSYITEMNYCVDFAFANRQLMIDNIKSILHKKTGCSFGDTLNIAHNYARLENHFGKNVMVHRKGATSAKVGEIGIIPGSQGTKSYIVSGLGNNESFRSCSHGAGRKMGRKQATRTLNLKDEIAILDNQGIIHGIRHEQDLDEAVGAYKDIDIVMDNQKDLVEILVELRPIAVIKG